MLILALLINNNNNRYTTIARENKDRIVKIFVRDVTTSHVKDLPPQPVKRSYSQTFTSTYKYLRNYYSGEFNDDDDDDDKNNNEEVKENKDDDAKVTSTRDMKDMKDEVAIKQGDSTNEQSESSHPHFTRILKDITHLHTSFSSLMGLTDDENAREVGKSDVTVNDRRRDSSSSSSSSGDEEEEMKTPLEAFQDRLEILKKDLPDGLFSTFTDPNELNNDPVIKKYLNL